MAPDLEGDDTAVVTIPTSRGSVLLVDDDLARLRAVSEALRAQGHEVLAFADGAEAHVALPGTPIDVVVATAVTASLLEEARREPTRNAAWVVRGSAGGAQRARFIASVAIDASPRIVADAVAAALMMRRPRSTPPSTPVYTPPDPVVRRLAEPAERFVPRRVEPAPYAPPPPPPVEAPPPVEVAPAAAPAPSAHRRVAVVARDAKTVRRLCERFEASGMLARGFTAARTARDVAMTAPFDAIVVEEQLDGLDGPTLAARLTADLGERAPRVVLLAQPASVVSEPAITTVVRSPTTADAILEALVRTLDAPRAAPPEEPADDTLATDELDAEELAT